MFLRRTIKHGNTLPPAINERGIGINITNVQDYSADKLFCDCIKTSRKGSVAAPYDGNCTVDINGFPTQDCGLYLWPGSVVINMNGTYKLSFTGQATVGGNFTISNKVYNAGINQTTADAYMPADGTDGTLTFTNTKRLPSDSPGTGLNNISLLRPGYISSDVFTREIKALIVKFRVIRFMDVTGTNFSQIVNWSDRMPKNYATQQRFQNENGYSFAGIGIAYEWCIDLCNLTNKNMWINIPEKASDDFVLQFATLIQSNLNSNLKIYIERSNEIWNTNFQQFTDNYNAAQTEAVGSDINSSIAFDGETNPYYLAWRRNLRKLKDISNTFRSIFGDSAMHNRINIVYAHQQSIGTGTMYNMNYMDGYWNNPTHTSTPHPVNYYFSGSGGSAYYSCDNTSDSLTIDNIWASNTFNVNTWKPDVEVDSAWSVCFFGPNRYWNYESGPSMDNFGHSESIKALAWNDVRMSQLVVDHQKAAEEIGASLVVYYNSTSRDTSNWNAWAFSHAIEDLTTAKITGINEINTVDGYVNTFGTTIPGTISTSIGANSVYSTFDRNMSNMNANDYFGQCYKVVNPTTFTFTITTIGSGSIDIIIDGNKQGSTNTLTGSTVVTKLISLGIGLHGIIIKAITGSGISISSIVIT